MTEQNAYILGTEKEERDRLGLQAQVWAEEAQKGWRLADFNYGQTLLDLGCGPGFCTRELAYLVGQKGKVIGVDRSETYIQFLQEIAKRENLSIETQCCDFKDMNLKENSLDGAYCRWALAWLKNPEETIDKVYSALKPGGAFVIHEYHDWRSFTTVPHMEELDQCIEAAFKSFSSTGEINVGKNVPGILYDAGFEVMSVRPMSKIATSESLSWNWPATFLPIYLPKVAERGLIDMKLVEIGLQQLEELSDSDGALIICPSMIEIIGVKLD